MTKFTFYGGAGEIGGNKILLEGGGAKCYLDFGMPFDFGEGVFLEEENLSPRIGDGLAPYFAWNLVPKVPGLYSKEMLNHTDLKYQKGDIDAVFLTHHHSDHTGELKFLDPQIPVHLGHGTLDIMRTYAELYPRFCKYGYDDSCLSRDEEFIGKRMHPFKSGDSVRVKGLEFNPIHVEHSTPGAYGYVIKNEEEGNIAFSGDLRMHGHMASMTEEFIREAEKSCPKIMLCEGTRMPVPEKELKKTGLSAGEIEEVEEDEKKSSESEAEVKKRCFDIISESNGLVFAHFAMCNVDRLKSIWEAAKEAGRKLVIDPRYAFLIDSLNEKIDWLPDSRDEFGLYYRLNSKGDWSEKHYDKVWKGYYGGELPEDWLQKSGRRKPGMYRTEEDMGKWTLTYKELQENPEDYVLFVNFTRFIELAHINPKGGDYIYSSSEHFLEGEDNKKMRTVMLNWLEHYNIKMHKVHCSGHAAPNDIKEMIRRISPDILIPIHTLNPEAFCDFHSDVRIPSKNGTMDL